MAEEREKFLSRWSRLKQEAQEKDKKQEPPAVAARNDDAPPPELPPLEKLNLDSDYRGFFHPKVGENLRRAALKRLFADPHFNVMDGLDVYIDDYSKPNPLPAEMLGKLRQAQRILDWTRETEEEKGQERAGLPSSAAPALETQQPADPAPALERRDAERIASEQNADDPLQNNPKVGGVTPENRKT